MGLILNLNDENSSTILVKLTLNNETACALQMKIELINPGLLKESNRFIESI